jgi:hypothetical protein
MESSEKLKQELETILTPLGVTWEEQETSEPQKQKKNEVQITCLYSTKDAFLWNELQNYLNVFKYRCRDTTYWQVHGITNEVSLAGDATIADPIKEALEQADIIIIGLSIDLALCLYEHGRSIYDQLVKRTHGPGCPEMITVLFRAMIWQDDELPLRPTIPTNRPLASKKHRDVVYVHICRIVEETIQDILSGDDQ